MKPLTAPFGTDDSASWERDKFSPDKQKVTGAKSSISVHPFNFSFLPSPVLHRQLSSPISAFGCLGISIVILLRKQILSVIEATELLVHRSEAEEP